MITPKQIREVRALLGWSRAVLAEKAGVPIGWISKYERHGLIMESGGKLTQIIEAVKAAGVEFTNGDKLGVKVRKQA